MPICFTKVQSDVKEFNLNVMDLNDIERIEAVEGLIKLGKNEMYNRKNFEKAEEIFIYAKKLAPDIRTHCVSALLDYCREFKSAENKKHDSDYDKAYLEQSAGHTGEACVNNIRGGRKALEDKTSRYENFPKNINYSASTSKAGTANIKMGDDATLLDYDQAQQQQNYRDYHENDRPKRSYSYEPKYTEPKKINEEHDTHWTKSEEKKQDDLEKGLGLGCPSEKDKQGDKNFKEKADNNVTCRVMYTEYGGELQNNEFVNPLKEECKINTPDAPVSVDTSKMVEKQEDKEAEMLLNSLIMRSYILHVGIRAFASKPNYRTDVDFETVSLNICDLVLRARSAFSLRNERYEYYISEAEKIYSEVAIILPQASMSKNSQIKHKNANNDKNNPYRTSGNSAMTPEENVKSVSYKEFVKGDNIDVEKCLKLAETALIAKDFKKAERLIKKSERILPTKNAQRLFKKLEEARKEEIERKAAKQAAELAARQAEELAAKQAEELAAKQAAELAAKQASDLAAKQVEELAAKNADALDAKHANELAAKEEKELLSKEAKKLAVIKTASKKSELFNASTIEHNFKEEIIDWVELQDGKVVIKTTKFEQLLNKPDKNMNDLIIAQRILLEAKRLYPQIDIDCLQKRLRIDIASRSSTNAGSPPVMEDEEPLVQLTHDKKRNSKQYYKVAKECLKKSDIKRAKIYLLEAQKYYNSIDVKCTLELIENLSKSEEDANEIPEPSYFHSCSENHFALHSGEEEEAPSYHFAKSSDLEKDKTEEYLKKGRLALTNKNFDKAEEYALMCMKASPVRAKGLLQEIEEKKKNTQGTMTLRSGLTLNTNSIYEPGYRTQKDWNTIGQLQSQSTFDKTHKNFHETGSLNNAVNGRNILEQAEGSTQTESGQSTELNDRACRSGKNIESNKEAYNDCIKKAEQAVIDKDYDTAERLMKRAYRMNPYENLKLSISNIQCEKKIYEDLNIPCNDPDTQIERPNNNQIEAKKCVKLAEDAYAKRDLDKAERLFAKAFRMDSSKTIQDFLLKVRKEIDKDKDNSNAENSSGKICKNEIVAEKFNNSALDAININCHYSAEHYLEKANHIYPNEATTDLLKTVRASIQESLANTHNDQQKKTAETEKQKQMKIEADKYLKMAEENLELNDLDNAQSFAILSDSFYKSNVARKLLKRIIDLKYSAGKDNQRKKKITDPNYNYFKAERYIEMAEIAFNHGESSLAQEYLVESKKFYHIPKAQEMLVMVLAAIKAGHDRSSHDGWFQKGVNWFKETLL